MMKLQTIISWIVTLLLPVVLVLGAVRIVLNPWFVEFEYRTPNFPADSYGFTREDRLVYSKIAIAYLLNDQDITFLGDLRFPEGQSAPPESCYYMEDCTKLYNEGELQHMVDVKNVIKAALTVWYTALFSLLVLGIWAWRGGWLLTFRIALARGSLLTVALIGALLLGILVAFGVVFVQFHEVFFESGTWTFLWSDTLIRLFPERFWRDTFMMVGGLSAGMGVILFFGVKKNWKHKV